MPYGIDADLWRRLPPEDQVAIASEVTDTSHEIGGYAQTVPAVAVPASSAPPPNLSSGTISRSNGTGDYPAAQTVTAPTKPAATPPNTSTGWTLAAQEAQIGRVSDATATTFDDGEDDVLVLPGPRIPRSQGVTLVTAPIAAPTLPPPAPTAAAQPGQSQSPPTQDGSDDVVALPGVRPILDRPGITTTPATAAKPTSALRTNAPDSGPSQTGTFELFAYEPPSETGEGLGTLWKTVKTLKDVSEKFHIGEASGNADKAWQNWVKSHWRGAPFTTAQLQAVLSIIKPKPLFSQERADQFARTNPPGAFNPFAQQYIPGNTAARLIARAQTLEAQISAERVHAARVRDPERLKSLQGALSATGLALAIVDYSNLGNIPYAGKYVGAGNPAAALGAFFDTLDTGTEKVGLAHSDIRPQG